MQVLDLMVTISMTGSNTGTRVYHTSFIRIIPTEVGSLAVFEAKQSVCWLLEHLISQENMTSIADHKLVLDEQKVTISIV
jgi:hypothetical protein